MSFLLLSAFGNGLHADETVDVNENIWSALWDGNVGGVRRALKEGADVNHQNADGETPLLYAAQDGRLNMVKLLIEQGAKPNIRDNDGETPLFGVVHQGDLGKKDRPRIAKYLIDHGADVNIKNMRGETIFGVAMKVALNGGVGIFPESVDLLKVLIENGIDIKQIPNRPALLSATIAQNMEIVRALLKRGADVNESDKWGMTPLSQACDKGNEEIALLLLERGADPTRKAQGIFAKEKPLFTAAGNGMLNTVKELIARGALVDEFDVKFKMKGVTIGTSPLFEAISGEKMNVVDYFLSKQRVDVNKPDPYQGTTPLLLAVRHGNPEVIKFLLRKGSHKNIADKHGETPLDAARKSGNKEIARLLGSAN